ncbi:MAG: hypothetical protein JAZ17_16205 [Candidatus Thiodiazotropha endolucinida]|nr:hypothetical protein [Candidatus Thiodiazotropha endolucinida]
MTNILLVSLIATVFLAAISSWRQSFVGYLGILTSIFVFICAFFIESILEALYESDLTRLLIELGLLILSVGYFWLFFTMKYITDSSVFDLTYQSMPKFKEYVDRKGYRTNFESLTIISGYTLFASTVLFFAFYIYVGR